MQRFRGAPLTLVTTFFFWFSLYAYSPTMEAYSTTRLGLNAAFFGIIVGSYGLTQMLLRIPLGVWSDAIGRRKPFVMAGLAASVASSAILYLMPTPLGALLGRGVAGVAAAGWVAFTVMYVDQCIGVAPSRSIGNINATNQFGQMISMLLGGYCAQAWGLSAPFPLALAAAVVGLILSCFIEDTRHEPQPQSIASRLSVAKNAGLMIPALLAIVVQFISFSTAFGYTARWAREALNARPEQLGWLTMLFSLGAITASRISGSYLAPKFGERVCVIAGFFGIAAGCALMPFTREIWQIYLVQFVFFGLTGGICMPLLMALAVSTAKPGARSATMGFYQSIYGLGMFIGPVIAGRIVEGYGLAVNYYTMAILSVVTAFIAIPILKLIRE